jgi:hypothetical protein
MVEVPKVDPGVQVRKAKGKKKAATTEQVVRNILSK